MITRRESNQVREQVVTILSGAPVVLRQDELNSMEIADFGLSDIKTVGAQIITLVHTETVAVKLIVMLPRQTMPEHRHPRLGNYPGKEETIRCVWGKLYLYSPGTPTANPGARVLEHRRHVYSVWHERIMVPGDQVTLPPNTLHWFQGGSEGAVIWSFSSKAYDTEDIFTDPEVQRQTIVVD